MTSKRFELGWWVVKRRAPFHPFINLAWRVVLAIVLGSALVPSAGFRVSRKRTSMGNRSLGAFYRVRRCGKSAKPGRLRQHSARPPCNRPSPSASSDECAPRNCAPASAGNGRVLESDWVERAARPFVPATRRTLSRSELVVGSLRKGDPRSQACARARSAAGEPPTATGGPPVPPWPYIPPS